MLDTTYARDGGRKPAQYGAGRVRRMVRRRLAEQSRHVSLALDRREVSVGGRGDRRRTQRLSHERTSASRAAASQGTGSGSPRRACIGAAGAAPTSSICAATPSTATCRSFRRKSPSRAFTPVATSATRSTTSPVEVGAIAFEDERGSGAHFSRQSARSRAQRAARVSRPHGSRRHGGGRAARGAPHRQAAATGEPVRRSSTSFARWRASMTVSPSTPISDDRTRRRRGGLAGRRRAWASAWATALSARPSEQSLQSVIRRRSTPAPNASPQAYGPDWKRSQALSAAGDPHFPDPARSAAAVADAARRRPNPSRRLSPPRRRRTRTSRSGARARCRLRAVRGPSAEVFGPSGSPTPEPSPRKAKRRRRERRTQCPHWDRLL